MKKVGKILLTILLVVVLAMGGLVGWLTAAEYNPPEVESLDAYAESAGRGVHAGDSLEILSWNIGYAGLGAESDFFMDGGTHTASADETTVRRYLSAIAAYIAAEDPDVTLLQEVDVNSTRSRRVDELAALSRRGGWFALNYYCPFVPFPMPPIGRVESGLFTDTDLNIKIAHRIALPCPFSWPVRAANLKRGLLVTRMDVEGTDKELVFINLHLEAYDDGEGKRAQTKVLRTLIDSEYDRGNYVIAGGDFNQTFPGSLDIYPNDHPENWTPGVLEETMLPQGFSFAYDLDTPSCRLLNQPYDPADTDNTQYYVIDGFFLSPNVRVDSVETVDLGFENSDHNPVLLRVTLE